MSDYHAHIQRIVRHMIESGLTREQRLNILTAYTGRTITTTYDLNRNEASCVVQALALHGRQKEKL